MVGSALSFVGGVHINARAQLYINLIWFGDIARLSQWGEEEDNFLDQMVLPAVDMCRGRGGGSAPGGRTLRTHISVVNPEPVSSFRIRNPPDLVFDLYDP